MKAHIVIPARLASARFPSKLLAPIDRVPVLGRTITQALGAQTHVHVATHDRAVLLHAKAWGAIPELTSDRPRNGTERCAEVAARYGWQHDDIVVNWQGDAPFVPAGAVVAMVETMADKPGVDMMTLGTEIPIGRHTDPNIVKMRVEFERVRGFSRHPGPAAGQTRLWHIGIYAYRVGALLRYAAAAAATDEELEGLEQIRAISLGMRVWYHLLDKRPGPEINTPQDIEEAERWLQQQMGVAAEGT